MGGIRKNTARPPFRGHGSAESSCPGVGVRHSQSEDLAGHREATTQVVQLHLSTGEAIEKVDIYTDLQVYVICKKRINCKSIWYTPCTFTWARVFKQALYKITDISGVRHYSIIYLLAGMEGLLDVKY